MNLHSAVAIGSLLSVASCLTAAAQAPALPNTVDRFIRAELARQRIPGMDQAVTEFVGRERLCCPFLTLTLELMPEQGPLVLQLTGPEGVKDFIRAELSF